MTLDKLGPTTDLIGTKVSSPVTDDDTFILLTAILKELQMTNLYLMKMCDEEITKGDL